MSNCSIHNEHSLFLHRFEKLQQLCDKLQRQNNELESRFLQTVEKVEQDKLLLSNEIDHLAERLANATNVTSYLEHECQRYKHDCQIAVQLLQCRPPYVNAVWNAAVSNEKIKDLIENYAINHTNSFKDKKDDDNIPPEPDATTSRVLAVQSLGNDLSSICKKCNCDLIVQKSDGSQTDTNAANSLIDFHSDNYLAQKSDCVKSISNRANDQKVVHEI